MWLKYVCVTYVLRHAYYLFFMLSKEKTALSSGFGGVKSNLSPSVSRVLSCTAIYLGLPSPISSSDIHGIRRTDRPTWRIPNLAASGVYMAYHVTVVSVSSYLAFPSLPQRTSHKWENKSLMRRFISVALSLKSPSPDVIRHPVLCCSDFPHGQKTPRPYNKLKSLTL